MNHRYRDTPPKLRTMALMLGLLAIALVWLTMTDYGVASDVGNYFGSSLRQLAWAREFFENLRLGRPTAALEKDTVFEYWRWYLPRIPHPPLSRELGGLTWFLTHRWLDALTAYRLAVMLSYGVLVGWVAVFTFWAARSRLAGLIAGLAALSYPALFAHGHLAHTDLFLTTFWFIGAAAMAIYVRTLGVGWLVAAGLLLGAAAATKFTGVLLAPVLVLWLLVRRPSHAAGIVILAGVAVATFFAVNPVLWVAPKVGLADYLGAGIGRASGEMTRLRTEYFGRIYEFRPPWHYVWVWSAVVLPPSFMIAIAAAIMRLKQNWIVPFCLLNMGVLYAALLLPSAPMHDGIRLLLPVLPFQCVLVGIGGMRLIDFLESRLADTARPWLESLVVVALIVPAAASSVRIHPYQLSYVNLLVGGVSGAEAKGLEVTNLKEVFSRRVLADLNLMIPDGAVVDPGFLTEEMCFYQAQGFARTWTAETQLTREGGRSGEALACVSTEISPVLLNRKAREPDWVFVLNRKAVWRPVDRALFLYGGPPAYEISVDGVPLFRAYRTR
ncbi:MAG: hypothetical protein OEM23_06580 [Gemmatimonadota bacterium]|nr:hypothetical protein [Gemmatimonadota bacterium]